MQGFNSCFWLRIAVKPANTDIESAPARGGVILEKCRSFGWLYCAAHCVIFETRKILRCYNGLREFLQTYRRQRCVAGGVLFGLLGSVVGGGGEMKGVLLGVGLFVLSFVVIVLLIPGLNRPRPPMVDFDFKGLRIGDPAPAWLKVETPKDDFVSHAVEGTKWEAWFSILDGNIESITIDFDDAYEAVSAYETKFGVRGLLRGNDVVWMTKDGEFVISKEYGHARIYSEKYTANAVESVKKKNDELSSKL